MTHLAWRRVINCLGFLHSGVATLIGLGVLAAILWKLQSRACTRSPVTMFTQMTPAPGSQGGLLNAIVGSLVMTGLGMAIAAPVGILAGTYLGEYGRGRAQSSRFASSMTCC